MKANALLNWNHFLFPTSRKDLLINLSKYLRKRFGYTDVITTMNKKDILKVEVNFNNQSNPVVLLVLDCGSRYPTEYYGKTDSILFNKNDLSNILKNTA